MVRVPRVSLFVCHTIPYTTNTQAAAESTGDADFDKAVAYVRGLPADGPVKLDDATRLKFYGI